MPWQIFVTVRVGTLKLREVDATPLLCFALIAAVIALVATTTWGHP